MGSPFKANSITFSASSFVFPPIRLSASILDQLRVPGFLPRGLPDSPGRQRRFPGPGRFCCPSADAQVPSSEEFLSVLICRCTAFLGGLLNKSCTDFGILCEESAKTRSLARLAAANSSISSQIGAAVGEVAFGRPLGVVVCLAYQIGPHARKTRSGNQRTNGLQQWSREACGNIQGLGYPSGRNKSVVY
jgi:hypothetical protein